MRSKTKKIICLSLILLFVFLPLAFAGAFVFCLKSGRLKRHMARALGERTDKLVEIKALRFLSPTQIILDGVKFLAPQSTGREEPVFAVLAADSIKLDHSISGLGPYWNRAEVQGAVFSLHGPKLLSKDFRFVEKLLGPQPRRVGLRQSVFELSWCDTSPSDDRFTRPSVDLIDASGHLEWDGLGKMALRLTGREDTAVPGPPVHLRGHIHNSATTLESVFFIKGKRLASAMDFLEMALPAEISSLSGDLSDGEIHLGSRGANGSAEVKGILKSSDLKHLLYAFGLRGIEGCLEGKIKQLSLENDQITQFQVEVLGNGKGKLDEQTVQDLNFLLSGERPVISEEVSHFTYERLGLGISYDGQKTTFRGLIDEEGRVAIESYANNTVISLITVSPEPIGVDLLRERWQEIEKEGDIQPLKLAK